MQRRPANEGFDYHQHYRPAPLTSAVTAFFSRNGKPWDHAPAVVLVEEAGGMFSDSFGGHSVYLGEGRFTNGLIHRELDALLAT